MAHLDTKVAQLCPTLCDPMDYTMPQLEKNLPAMQDTWVRSLGWEDPLEIWKPQPTPAFLTREFHGHRSLAGYSPWGCKESDTTE